MRTKLWQVRIQNRKYWAKIQEEDVRQVFSNRNPKRLREKGAADAPWDERVD